MYAYTHIRCWCCQVLWRLWDWWSQGTVKSDTDLYRGLYVYDSEIMCFCMLQYQFLWLIVNFCSGYTNIMKKH